MMQQANLVSRKPGPVQPAVVVAEVHRHFWVGSRMSPRNLVTALRGVSFTVREGETLAVVGPNGAGKTTLLKILSTLLVPSSGTVQVFGRDLVAQSPEVRRMLGVTFGGERGFFDRLSSHENLVYAACLYGIPKRHWAERIRYVLNLVGLESAAHRPVGTYSRGMKQRLHLARALVHDPRLLILDEPTSALDVEAAYQVRQLISEFASLGKTIIFSTHNMSEGEQLADRVATIDQGVLQKIGTPREYIEDLDIDYVIELQRLSEDDALRIQRLYGAIAGAAECYVHRGHFQWSASVTVRGARPQHQHVASTLQLREDVKLTIRPVNLEDAYLQLVSEERNIDETLVPTG